jgi:hypothetical protein
MSLCAVRAESPSTLRAGSLGFYQLVRDGDLAWCALGAGRMLRGPTVFEDVVRTI